MSEEQGSTTERELLRQVLEVARDNPSVSDAFKGSLVKQIEDCLGYSGDKSEPETSPLQPGQGEGTSSRSTASDLDVNVKPSFSTNTRRE